MSKKTIKGFTIVQNEEIALCNYKELGLLTYLKRYLPSYPSYKKIANDLKMSPTSIAKQIKALKTKGLLTYIKGNSAKFSNQYSFPLSTEVKTTTYSEVVTEKLLPKRSSTTTQRIAEPLPKSASNKTKEIRLNNNIEAIASLWNQMADQTGLARVRTPLTDHRVTKVKSALKEFPQNEDWKKIITQVPQSDFRLGQIESKTSSKVWKANFDWLFIKNNYLKMIEEYENENN